MSREQSPYILGPYWLAKRKDGKSPDIWQITSYNQQTRSLHYRSTTCRALPDAIEAIKVFHALQNFDTEEGEDDASVAVLILQYVNEHASKAISASSLCANMRLFVGFLMQDDIGIDACVSQLRPQVFERYRAWRMGPHSYELNWQGKIYRRSSQGVVGETVSKNLDDVRAALNHAVSMGRLKAAPRVPALKREYRSPPRDRVLSYEELGAMVGYASFDPPMLRWLLLMVATAMRPEAALKLVPKDQYRPDIMLLDLHPVGAPRTKKRNPIVPVIPEFHPWLLASNGNFVSQGRHSIQSMKRRWRTMRRELKLGPDVVSKTVRHTVATRLRSMGATMDHIAALLGHQESNRITAVYAKYDPHHMGEVRRLLSQIWLQVMSAADEWRAANFRDTGTNASCIVRQREQHDKGAALAIAELSARCGEASTESEPELPRASRFNRAASERALVTLIA